jgi:N-acyl-D-amino-acid deacylase
MASQRLNEVISQAYSRRRVLGAAGAGLLVSRGFGGVALAAAQATPAGPIPISGEEVPELKLFDTAVLELMSKWGLPGAQLSVGYEGRLVFSRGYGYADTEAGVTVQRDHRFRIASVSKTITTVGILRLVDAQKLALTDKVFPMLNLEPPPNAPTDPRLAEITVGELLIHAGGWDVTTSGDPQSVPLLEMIGSTFALPDPPKPEEIIRFMLGNFLDFDPGTKSIYSNFGFDVLGRVIEHISGQTYEAFSQEQVLGPAGVEAMQLGKTKRDEQAENEVTYYQPPEFPATIPSVFPGEGFAPVPYGGFFIESMDSHGGWIADTDDLVRYATAIDGQRGTALLQPATVETLLTAPRPKSEWYNGNANMKPAKGLGWCVQPGPTGEMEWGHTGALGGSNSAWLMRNETGMTIAFATNTLPFDFIGWFGALIPNLTDVGYAITSWPTHDLFEGAS